MSPRFMDFLPEAGMGRILPQAAAVRKGGAAHTHARCRLHHRPGAAEGRAMSSSKRFNQPSCITKANIGKRKAIQERIRRIEESIGKAMAYLKTGRDAN